MSAIRILVVEDEENIAYVVTAALQVAGFEVDHARLGRDGLKLATAGAPYDLLVLDVMLPDIDGFDLCQRLRGGGIGAPVIFLTARDAKEDRLRGLTIGGDDYLTKPFSVEELVARVRVILRRVGKGVDSPTLTIGTLELDDDAHAVSRSGQLVALSPSEYKLLRFFMRNPGRALSREQILDHVWNYDFDGESTVVETVLWSLRKKLDTKDRQFITTVRGVGYRLDRPASEP